MGDPKLIEWQRYQRRYGHRPDALLRAQRGIFREDIMQPNDPEFKEIYKKSAVAREKGNALIEKEARRREQKKDELYRSLTSRQTLTLEQKTLKDLQKDHPNMVNEEDILKWPT